MRNNLILVLLLLGAGMYIAYAPRNIIVPQIENLRSFPAHFGQWTAVRDTVFNEPTLKVLRPSDYLMRTYTNAEGEMISVYIGYHNGGAESGPIHSPKNCLPSSGWLSEASREMQIPAGGDNVNLVRADFKKDSTTVTYYYWYQIRSETITRDLSMKLAEFTGMLLRQRKDASFIRIGTACPDPAKGDALIRDFLKLAYPALKNHLPS